ncbi:MAG: UDP-N-acetylglucosamine 1-carboxyvinyltransferase [Candidatus Magasanikbacteria bacterium GW2011_GWA2_56_11]|uniref:UDP-N-acetylglucosamine 1-carboxyvinyltransferase n=1 Tax=Candidatus Magasanikbacteria bacterium GW2011_GWA2_56_11 TaxID=1619044 RepID=A0A0G1YE39_9BACT|nr:MAG: UDP-N-acetylglucosamine 1-carboxyvinyltransferase [Candidatus Magasanikbacteria bacterium GW2011_GWA2_56_11]
MSKFIIEGGRPLGGVVKPIGNKNAILKMIPATLLTAEPVTFENVPAISDVTVMLGIMKELGAKVDYRPETGRLTVHTPAVSAAGIEREAAQKMRASNMFLGPLLARQGQVTSFLPGGDKIGPREMTAHFDGLRQLGAKFRWLSFESFSLSGKLRGAEVFLYEPSVTATENVLLAAVLAPGRTTITNAASEPHVQALCEMLSVMGADIKGVGTNRLEIRGVAELRGATVPVPPDYVYVGTMIVLSAVTGGELTVKDVRHEDLKSILYFFRQLGIRTQADGADLVVPKRQRLTVENQAWARTKGIYSQPWPCFPTDMMSLAIVLATQAKGATLFFEKMYPGRMFFADYLNGMGANIIIADPHRVVVNGRTPLEGRPLQAPDLRAGMAYVAAGLAAAGRTTVESVEHIDRGYPHLESTLQKLGAQITRSE